MRLGDFARDLRSQVNERPIVVLHGAVAENAPPDEQDVLVEVQTISGSLERLGYRPTPLPLTLNLESARKELRAQSPAFVFNLVESIGGSGRLAPLGTALLEELGLPYTGVPQTGFFLSSNKLLAKRLLTLAGIPTPAIRSGAQKSPHPPFAKGGRRGDFTKGGQGEISWIVKSVWEHASIGIDDESVVDAHAVDEILAVRRARFGGEWFAEEFIEGREFNVALIGDRDTPQVLPLAEIGFVDFPDHKPRIVGYTAKWSTDSFEYSHTPRSFEFVDAEQPLLDELASIAKRCWALFECRGYARVDFRVDREGQPWVLEVNANPCLAPDAGFAAAAEQAGLSYDDVITRIVEASLRQTAETQRPQRGQRQDKA